MGVSDPSTRQRFGSRIRVSSQEDEPCLHGARSQLQGMLRLRSDVPLLVGVDVDNTTQKDVSGPKALEP